jgi:hypothetical protein
VPKPLLDNLGRQFQAAISPTVDAPGREEVSEVVHPSVFRGNDRFALLVDLRDCVVVEDGNGDSGPDLDGMQAARDDVAPCFDISPPVGKNQVQFAPAIEHPPTRTFQLPFPKGIQDRQRYRYGPLAALRLGGGQSRCSDRLVA